ncbi:NAD(P)/FAD-dependent oxidoreductase [Corynebacterium sp.]|uniref:dihydrolipoyl dehydrogenase family protein n=1 Tax=Corynebacterium sp. TaxID=1720 RepID=UPI0026E094BA|nr:FAD-dependent oxidoreductase [Corynebacterium sp.]MDO5512073.1 FAD-dependent oxidoreductase [Corynebacterium sp.]
MTDLMSDHTLTVDLLVIGWGKAGKTLAAGYPGKVALVEQFRSLYGGTCINIACVPTKTLIHSADDGTPFPEAREHRDSLIDKLNEANRAMLDDAVIIDGRARFSGPHTVTVSAGEESVQVTAPRIVINTGAVARIPDIEGLDPADIPPLAAYDTHTTNSAVFHDSTSIQHVDPLPQRLLIVGAGPIGLEFASMFAGFGSRVQLLNNRSGLFGHLDEGIGDEVEESLTARGVEVVEGELVRVEKQDGGVRATLQGGTELLIDAVLFATGRQPATEGLGLEEAGIEVTDRGAVSVDEYLRTSVEGVWAAGDVNGGPQFTYISYDDHRIIAPQLDGGEAPHGTDQRVAVPTTTFLTPPLSTVGMTRQEAEEAGHEVRVLSKKVADIAAMPRPKTLGITDGRITFLLDASTHEILGAQLWCTDSQELINMVALAMRAGLTAEDLRDGIWTHPSSTEAFNDVLKGL